MACPIQLSLKLCMIIDDRDILISLAESWNPGNSSAGCRGVYTYTCTMYKHMCFLDLIF